MEHEGKVNYQSGGKGIDPKQLIETRTLKFGKLLEELTLARHSAIIGIPFWKLRKFSNFGLPDLMACLVNALAESFVCFSVIFHARQVDGKRTKQR